MRPDSDQGRILGLELLLACFFASSHLAARLALLLCVDVDGRLVDARECVVSWIVSGGMGQKNGHRFDTNFLETHWWLILTPKLPPNVAF